MDVQDFQDSSFDDIYEEPQTIQFNAHDNVQVRINQGSARSKKHEQETASNGRTSRVKTALLVICLIVTIASASATAFLFTKVMNNKELHTQLDTLSTNFNFSIEKVKAMIIYDKKSLKKQQEMINGLEQKVYQKLSEMDAHLNDIDNSLPIASCAKTSINGVRTLKSGGWVYCSNGWTVFQRRMDGIIPDFHNKTWEQYREGFGIMTEEFWLGLRKLHEITRHAECRLHVDLQSFDNDTAYADYSNFSVGNEANLFRLTVGGYNGTAGDSLADHNGMSFSTNERDNDKSSRNCATKYHSGGWWNKNCFAAAPNGIYGETRPGDRATNWYDWKRNAAMKFIQMGVRCD